MPPREKILLRFERGALIPNDDYSKRVLRDRGYKIGDVVSCDIRKARNSKFNRLVHALGLLVSEQIEDFKGKDGHTCLKMIQLSAGIACDVKTAVLPGIGECLIKFPLSLSYGSMDEKKFQDVALQMCRWIAETYWPTMTADQVQVMAERFITE